MGDTPAEGKTITPEEYASMLESNKALQATVEKQSSQIDSISQSYKKAEAERNKLQSTIETFNQRFAPPPEQTESEKIDGQIEDVLKRWEDDELTDIEKERALTKLNQAKIKYELMEENKRQSEAQRQRAEQESREADLRKTKAEITAEVVRDYPEVAKTGSDLLKEMERIRVEKGMDSSLFIPNSEGFDPREYKLLAKEADLNLKAKTGVNTGDATQQYGNLPSSSGMTPNQDKPYQSADKQTWSNLNITPNEYTNSLIEQNRQNYDKNDLNMAAGDRTFYLGFRSDIK